MNDKNMKLQLISRDILFLIVTYKEKYHECNSYISLKRSYYHLNNRDKELNIYIADNTDVEGWDCGVDLEPDDKIKIIYNKFNNPGLSYAYNRGASYAKMNNFSWIVLLDQDTTLPLDFFEKYTVAVRDNNIFLKVPLTLINKSRILSPSKYRGFRSYLYSTLDKGIMELKGHSFINTGLLINTDFFLKIGGYNEEIKLDFADHDFVYRCKKVENNFEVLDIVLLQDFSSVSNNKEQALKRYSLYLRDLKEFRKDKKNKMMLFFNADILRIIKLTFQYKTIDFIKLRFNL